MESDIHSRRMLKKTIKIVLKILYKILIIMCVVLTAIIVFQKITDNNRSIGGYRIFRVITGSMEPEYDVGEVVISKEINPNDIKVGDDIVYLGAYGEYNGKIIMHQVVAIDKDKNENLNFHAKGLHSASVEDPLIKESQIFGVVKFKSKILTLLYRLATSIYSAFIIITVLVLNVFISFKASGKKTVRKLAEPTNTEVYEDDYDEYVEEDVEEDVEDEILEEVEEEELEDEGDEDEIQPDDE